uniref:C2H2-type domain-containing protein n=1 Tax=Plectus sambesii TaxID=2011161 RepID=A0A914X218_9BILA
MTVNNHSADVCCEIALAGGRRVVGSSMDDGDQAGVDAGAPVSPSARAELTPIDLTAVVPGALVSPDSQNNNYADPSRPRSGSLHNKLAGLPTACDENARDSVAEATPSPAANDSTEFEGDVLYGEDGRCVYIVEVGASLGGRPELQETASNTDVRRAVYIQPGAVNHFSVVAGAEVDESQSPTDPIVALLMCVSCKLTFSSADSFRCHLDHDHYAHPSARELELLCTSTGGMSAIILADQRLRFLLPIKDSERSAPAGEERSVVERAKFDRQRTPEMADQVSPEELTRNLLLAQELSATRLLQQVSQNAMAMASMSNHAIGQVGCPTHSDGKQFSADCASCELAMAAQQSALSASMGGGGSVSMIGPHSSVSTARNSCKTLKCPKCNWHYKYQETLEIHMKEKHSESEVTCVYCMQNRAHPKLARGETYGCGYKPYRCDVCKYSTTTKGNLSIHMQSDKHLNNMHELQQGNKLLDPNDLIHADPPPPRTPTPKGTGPLPFRCDVCQYETNIARNLRIHMTSEKHGHNMRRSRSQPVPGSSVNDAFLTPSVDASLPLPGFQFPPLPDLTTFQIFQCCVCAVFGSRSVEEMLVHIEVDRSQPVEGDTMVMAGNFVCNLCQYRTNLKANFQLHTKTDKHLQRLQLVNHVREGGATNEWRMRFANVNSPVQLRCNACNEFFTCWNKLQAHSVTPQHLCCAKAYELIASELLPDHMIACKLCAFETVDRSAALAHLQSLQHGQNVSRWVSCDGPTDEIFVTRCCSDGGASDAGWAHLQAIADRTMMMIMCALCARSEGGEFKRMPPFVSGSVGH